MNKIKNILLNHFNEYALSNSPNSPDPYRQILFKDILLIIISYCTPYYENSIVNIDTNTENKIIAVKGLLDNKIATAHSDGSVNVWKLNENNKFSIYKTNDLSSIFKKNIRLRNSPYKLTYIIFSFSQIDINTIVYNFEAYSCIEGIFNLVIWNFETDIEKIYNCESIMKNGIICLNDDVIMYHSY